jgi:hypothetical protein
VNLSVLLEIHPSLLSGSKDTWLFISRQTGRNLLLPFNHRTHRIVLFLPICTTSFCELLRIIYTRPAPYQRNLPVNTSSPIPLIIMVIIIANGLNNSECCLSFVLFFERV